MDTCRICFKQKNILYSIHEIDKSRRISTLEIIASFALLQKNGVSEEFKKICHSCKVKAIETYDFKILIERSDMILNNINPKKQLKFGNISEVKSKLEYNEEIDRKPILPINLMREIDNGNTYTTYNNTTITKLNTIINKEIPVLDFLQSIEMEINHDDNDDCVPDVDTEVYSPRSDADDEYLPIKKKYKKKTKKGDLNSICIKPVYLKDVRVMYYEPEERKKTKKVKYVKTRKDICCYCGKLTKALKVHQLIHIDEKKYKCDICSKLFVSECRLKVHKKNHINTKDYKCNLCKGTFSHAHSLRSHMYTHSNTLNFFCNICQKGFKRKSALTRHLKQHNTENKNVQCELCPMTFFSKPALRHHMRVHTRERPYKCEICSQPYSYKRDFNRHCFKKHGVFINRRPVNVMNEEVLKRERELMNELLLRKQGILRDAENYNPFEGPFSAMAYEEVMKILENKSIQQDF